MRATRFEELDVWQLGRELRLEVYRLCSNDKVAKQFDLRDQLVSSAASICANVAEGFGRRSHPDFARCLTIAAGSANEVRSHLTDAVDRGLLTEAEIAAAVELTRRTGAALAAFIAYLKRTPTPEFEPRND